MSFSSTISSLKNLRLIEISAKPNQLWVHLDEFTKLIQKHHLSTDHIQEVRNQNIKREIRKHEDGYIKFNDKDYMSTSSILKYAFSHSDQLNICKDITKQINNSITEHTTIDSILDVYNLVINTQFYEKVMEDYMRENIELPEIKTLCQQYKVKFTEHEWFRISLFEHHFAKEVHDDDDEYEELVHKRIAFLESLNKTNELAVTVQEQCKHLVSQRITRHALENAKDGVLIHGPAAHIPAIVDINILHKLSSIFGSSCTSVICADSPEQHEDGLYVFVELELYTTFTYE